jgi:hypothetical protein
MTFKNIDRWCKGYRQIIKDMIRLAAIREQTIYLKHEVGYDDDDDDETS